ncbi:DnaD and phage-associated domain-containing protein [Salinibacillus kushneri]|uniref:DnaD and phage-associated domain-containing protein n=2 Tax=Salinibacillus kushneri TaxID=237682 RepID=A0A1I0B2Y8_9BACI|nr:DnaD and phage-associated domain-containing protein [Salinibacillus kushneri]
MNYLKEINAFYDWLETNKLSASDIVLWHALMHINNKSGWRAQFAVAISVLEMKTGLTRRTIERSRNRLYQCGLIEWKSRKGNQAAVYKMKSLDGHKVAQNDVQPVAQSDVLSVAQPVAITKPNETKHKQNKDLSYSRVIQTAQEYFMVLSPKQQMTLDSYIDDLGEELVLEAMKRAKREMKNFDYAAGVLRKWYQKGIKSLANVFKDDNQFEQFKHKKQQKGQKVSGDYSHLF